ncbi:Rossmann-fold NAD(P)-binding domain-containing protein [Pedobacter sandarakinus]|uniref:lactate dehydrogenase n=1 Tax=Pedobacter sandarakinus TaxID=353156 RepID=UPI002248238C|nr:lactate dehydrogenase [Pedobacter sandarakinus]MCX2574921.1 lactate dehydrogenase [Pedobacter sandarakinus]
MKAIAYNIRPDEKEWLVLANYKKHDITIIANSLTADTLPFAEGKEVLLVFNNDDLSDLLIAGLKSLGIRYIATSSSETKHLDLIAAGKAGMKVANVPLLSGKADPKSRMEQVIRNLDQWAAGKCLGKACCCQNNCGASKALK